MGTFRIKVGIKIIQYVRIRKLVTHYKKITARKTTDNGKSWLSRLFGHYVANVISPQIQATIGTSLKQSSRHSQDPF